MDYIAKCSAGLEEVLKTELQALGTENVHSLKRAVSFSASLEQLYMANICLRTATKIIWPIAEFQAADYDSLYLEVKKLNWQKYLSADATFLIEPVVNSSIFTHSQFTSLKVKDAIADYFRELSGKRPSVDTENPQFRIVLTIYQNRCSLALDSSGIPLFKRGYRQKPGLAPMKEDLAAGMLLMADYKAQAPFFDPFCGSGTLLAEAGMIACNYPPNLKRKVFGFMHWKNYRADIFEKVYTRAENQIQASAALLIGRDISFAAIEAASENLSFLKPYVKIRLEKGDFFSAPSPFSQGILICNPPYGERIMLTEAPDFYKRVGDKLKTSYSGFEAWIISSNIDALKHVGLKPARKIPLFNGKLPCSFRKYELYMGSKKIHKQLPKL